VHHCITASLPYREGKAMRVMQMPSPSWRAGRCNGAKVVRSRIVCRRWSDGCSSTRHLLVPPPVPALNRLAISIAGAIRLANGRSGASVIISTTHRHRVSLTGAMCGGQAKGLWRPPWLKFSPKVKRVLRRQLTRETKAAVALGLSHAAFIAKRDATEAEWAQWLHQEMDRVNAGDPTEILPSALAHLETRITAELRAVSREAAQVEIRTILTRAIR
jgi:hypothetical protein